MDSRRSAGIAKGAVAAGGSRGRKEVPVNAKQ